LAFGQCLESQHERPGRERNIGLSRGYALREGAPTIGQPEKNRFQGREALLCAERGGYQAPLVKEHFAGPAVSTDLQAAGETQAHQQADE
jgi:hypothetical protein